MDAVGEAVRVDALTVRFGSLLAVDGISFSVPLGSITGLIGRNGAGKSTTIRVLAGLLTPDPSTLRVEVLGSEVESEPGEMLRRTGFLLSEPALFPYLTPRETLGFLSEAYRIPPAEAERRVDDLLAFFGLSDAGDRIVDDFSTGMLKRLELAAALLHAPRLLILDEPFESLDPLMVRSLKQLLLRFRSSGGSVLLSSHLIDAVDETCDRIVIVEQGRIVTAGEVAEAKAGMADRLGAATLEELYASVVPSGEEIGLDWFSEGGASAK